MKLKNSGLIVRQIDRKIQSGSFIKETEAPQEGWIKLIRTTLNMSLRQLGALMSVSPQSVRGMEQREKEGTISLNGLQEAARALNMRLVYAFVTNNGSLEQMIDDKVHEMATRIVMRTSATMKLEDQQNSEDRIKEAIQELAAEIKREMPKKLWD